MNSVQSQHLMNYRASGIVRYAWLPIPIFILLIGTLWLADMKIVIEPPYLLPLFNFIFSTAVAFFVSYLAVISFSRNASVTVLMLGSGMLFFGTVSFIAAIAIQLGHINIGVTVYNTGVLFSGMCHLLAAAALTIESRVNRNAVLILSATYALVLTVIGLLTYAAAKGLTPVFFLQGMGPTPFRQAVLGTAVGIHLLSGFIIALVSRRFHWIFGRWYALSLLMIAIGLFGVLVISHVGSPLGWSGRAAQYVGGIYMLMAVLVGAGKNGEWDASLQAALKESQERYRMLVEATFEGIVISKEEVIVDVNEQFCRMLGYTESELIGKPISDLIPEKDRKRVVSTIFSGQDVTDEHFMLKKDGNNIVVESHGRTILRNGRHIRYSAVRDITDRKESEKALQESEQRYRALFTNMTEGFALGQVLFDPNGAVCDFNFLEINDAFEQQTGLSRQIIGRPMTEVLPNLEQHWIDTYCRVAVTGEGVHFQNYNKDTDRHYDVICYSPSKNCFAIIFLDITGQVNKEQLLRQVNERLQQKTEALQTANKDLQRAHGLIEGITRSTSDLIAAQDTNFRYIYFNEAYRREFKNLWGREIEIGTSMIESLASWPEDQQMAIDLWNRALKGESFGITEKFGPELEKQVYQLQFNPVYDAQGKQIGAAHILRNVTEQVRTQQALRESENRFRLLFENMAEGFFLAEIICDKSGKPFDYRHLKVNPALESLVNIKPEDLIGKTRLEVVKSQSPWIEEFGRVALTGKPEKFEGFSVFLNRHYSFSAYCPEHGKFACLVQDITERKQTEEAIKDLTKNLELRVAERTAVAEQRARQLQQLALELSNAEDKERKRMAMILHDDLQQHLGALRFNLFTLLPKDLIDDEVKDRLFKFEDLIDQAIKKTRSLSHELSPPVLHQSGFLAALNWLIKDVQEKHGQQVTLKSTPEAEPKSTVVASVLFRSVRELLFNALKHSETKTAFIEADVAGNFISVSVKDHGKGCDVEAVKARTSSTPGFGLFNIEERIKFLGGHFEIDSIPGNGCCVTVRVPKDPESTLQTVQVSTDVISKEKKQKQPQTADQLRIMLVDDHPSIRQGMSMFLKAITDFELLAEASNGIEAVRMARELKPDVVLMDISMPEMDGIEATAVIKKDHPNIRIIGLSMHEDEKTRERMLSAGASAYLNKAAPVNKIIEVIKNSRTSN
jgi:PAS domain S-box-containing protein